MTITKEKLTEWNLLKQHGDIQLIHDRKKISKDKIRAALKYGDVDKKTEKALDSFFNKRK